MSDDERIDIVSPNGKLGSVPKSGLEAALAQGFTYPDKAQSGELAKRRQYGEGTGTEIRAGLEGAARGLTFGLSDLAMAKSGLVDQEGLAERKARNPYAAGGGEAAGVIGGLALPVGALGAGVKGAAAAGELATKGAASLLTRAGVEGGTLASRALASGVKAATGSAVEGALYGAGQGVSEAALGDPADAAENLLGHVTMGALLGGGIGGAAGAIGGVGAKALKRLAEPATEAAKAAPGLAQQAVEGAGRTKPDGLIKDWLSDFAGEQALRAAGLPKSSFKKLQRGVKSLGNADNAAEAEAADMVQLHQEAGRIMRDKRLAQAGDTFEDVGRRVEGEINSAKQNAGNFIRAADEHAEATGGARFDLNQYADTLEKELAKPLEGRPAMAKELANVRDDINRFRIEAETRADQVTGGTGRISFADAEQMKRDLDSAFTSTNPSVGILLKRRSRALLNEQIEGDLQMAAKEMGEPKAFGQWKSDKRTMEALIPVLEGNKNKLQTLTANRTLSLTDQLAGLTGLGSLGVNPLGFASGLAMAGANKVMREYGSAAISDFAARAAGGLGPNRGAQALQLLTIERANNVMGQRLRAAADGIVGALNQAPKAVVPLSVDAADKLAMLPEDKADGNRAVTHALHDRITEITNLSSNPQLLQDRLEETMGNLPAFAPRVAAQMHFTAAQAVQHLASVTPQNPYATSPQSIRQAWRPPMSQMVAFERTLRAIHDPAGTIEEFRDGHVTKEAADALRAVYPSMYGKLLEQIVPAVVSAPKVPLQRRLQLANMLGVELDTFTSSDFAASLQQVYAESSKQAAPAARPAVSKNYRAQQSETPLQRALGGA